MVNLGLAVQPVALAVFVLEYGFNANGTTETADSFSPAAVYLHDLGYSYRPIGDSRGSTESSDHRVWAVWGGGSRMISLRFGCCYTLTESAGVENSKSKPADCDATSGDVKVEGF